MARVQHGLTVDGAGRVAASAPAPANAPSTSARTLRRFAGRDKKSPADVRSGTVAVEGVCLGPLIASTQLRRWRTAKRLAQPVSVGRRKVLRRSRDHELPSCSPPCSPRLRYSMLPGPFGIRPIAGDTQFDGSHCVVGADMETPAQRQRSRRAQCDDHAAATRRRGFQFPRRRVTESARCRRRTGKEDRTRAIHWAD